MTPKELWAIRRVGDPAALPGGGVVVPVTTFDLEENKGKDRLWLCPAPAGGQTGEPRPLTAPDVSSSGPTVSPDGRMLAFLRKPAGKEQRQAHVLPLDGGEAICVTDLPLGANELRWLPDSRRLVVLGGVYREDMRLDGTRRLRDERDKDKSPRPHVTEDRLYRFWDEWLTDGAVPHLFLVDAVPAAGAAAPPRDLTPDSDRWFDFMEGGQFDVAPDGSEVVFAANSSKSPHHRVRWAIYAVSTGEGSGAIRCLTPDNPAEDLKPRYSPDGRFVVYGRKHDPDFYADRVRLVRLDRANGTHQVLTETWDSSPAGWEFAPDGTLVVLAEDRGRNALFTMRVDAPGDVTPAPAPLLHDGWAHGLAIARDGYVYVSHQKLTRPSEVVRVPIRGGALERVSRFNDEQMAGIELGPVEEAEFPGANGKPIQMWIVHPPGFDPTKKYPLLHFIHGGPYGCHGDLFHFRWNPHVFVAPGYVGVMVNFHGSSGFGQEFAASIQGDWGGKCAQDLLLATDVLLERPYLDPERTAITGGSFGGYMTAWLASQTSRFRCAIAHAAVFNLPAMYAGDITQGWDREVGGAPWAGPEARAAIDRYNPAAFMHGYTTPTLVIHGERDYRVPVTQGLELYGMLKARGIEARLVYYADENHMILKPRNSLHWYGEFHAWLARFLG